MKLKVLALLLALVLVLSAVPATARAAAPMTVPATARAAAPMTVPAPVVVPAALPELAAPQAKTYSISLTQSGNGKAELYSASAGAKEIVYLLADPEPGYIMDYSKSLYHHKEHDLSWAYIGNNMYAITMPDGDVMLDLRFVKIPTDSHDVKLTVSAGGTATVDQKTAKKGESIFVTVAAAPGYSKKSVRARSDSGWNEGYYLKTVDGRDLYEIFMPDEDLEVLVDFTRNGPYAITPYLDTPGGTLELSHKTAYELETVTVTARPDRGYQVTSVGCYHSQLKKVRENVWSFSMPKFKEEVHVSFAPVVYPTSVTVETELGGRAYLDREGATIGTTVTLTCLPDAGYRVAQITGAELTAGGDNTYTFVMDNAPVELKVLFLRENNPFLDVNETQFYHDSVLWAVENAITNGVDASHFDPMGVCNRAQVVTFLWRAAGSPAPEQTRNPFTDVDAGTWYTDAVLWAVENGITNGVDASLFDPMGVCNRAQVVTFLHRASGSPEPGLAENPFTDVDMRSWYAAPVLWALEHGVTTGSDATHFSPNGQCLRAQVVTFLYRADQIPEPEPEPEPLPFPDPEK